MTSQRRRDNNAWAHMQDDRLCVYVCVCVCLHVHVYVNTHVLMVVKVVWMPMCV